MIPGCRNRFAPRLLLVFLCSCICFGQRVASAESWAETRTDMPKFENRLQTRHFVFKWTNRSSDPADNISDPAIIKKTAGYFEHAWNKYVALFGRTPYVPPGKSRIRVVFLHLDVYAYADPPGAPIQLNSSVWSKMPSIRQSTSAHELFHKLQYAFGYKTRWAPQKNMRWFIEGTAAWAEVYVWGRVTRSCKIEDMFKNTGLGLYDSQDMALPFWIYFVSGNCGRPKNNLMVRLFKNYERSGNPKMALTDTIRESYGPVDSFFDRFALERRENFWHGAALKECNHYTRILGPNGEDLVSKMEKYQHDEHEAAPGRPGK